MKTRRFVTAGLLLAVSFSLALDASATRKATTFQGTLFSSAEGRFSIKLPDGYPAFREKTDTTKTAVGDIELHFFVSETPRGACVLAYTDFPPQTFVGRTPEKILEDGRDGALKNSNATLEKQEHTTRQGFPALTMYASSSSNGTSIFVRFDIVLAQPRTYQVGLLAYDRAVLDGPEAQAYFKSFRIDEGLGPTPH